MCCYYIMSCCYIMCCCYIMSCINKALDVVSYYIKRKDLLRYESVILLLYERLFHLNDYIISCIMSVFPTMTMSQVTVTPEQVPGWQSWAGDRWFQQTAADAGNRFWVRGAPCSSSVSAYQPCLVWRYTWGWQQWLVINQHLEEIKTLTWWWRSMKTNWVWTRFHAKFLWGITKICWIHHLETFIYLHHICQMCRSINQDRENRRKLRNKLNVCMYVHVSTGQRTKPTLWDREDEVLPLLVTSHNNNFSYSTVKKTLTNLNNINIYSRGFHTFSNNNEK